MSSIFDEVRRRGIKTVRSYYQLNNIKTYQGIKRVLFFTNNDTDIAKTRGYEADTTLFVFSGSSPMSIARMREVGDLLQGNGLEIESSHSNRWILIK